MNINNAVSQIIKKENVLNLLVRTFISLVMKLPLNYCAMDEGEVFFIMNFHPDFEVVSYGS